MVFLLAFLFLFKNFKEKKNDIVLRYLMAIPHECG